MGNKILDKKHIIIIGIAIISIIVSYFNVTYAYFGTSKNEEISLKSAASFGEATVYNFNDIIEGNLTYTSNKTDMLKTTTTSFKKDNVEINDYLLTVALQVKPHETLYELDEYTSISYEIYHKTDLSLNTSGFTCTEDNKYNGEDYCSTGIFIENSLEGTPFELIKDFRISDTEMHYFDVYIYLNKDGVSKSFKANIFYMDKETEKEKDLYKQELLYGGDPDLSTGLIPVVYDENGTGSKWFVADVYEKWYSYTETEQWWANAVSVDSSTDEKRSKYVNEDKSFKKGVEIDEEDMLAMFVWIPRYSYTIGCLEENNDASCVGYKIDGASELDYSNTSNIIPGAIDIKFIAKNEKEDPGLTEDTPIYPTYTYSIDSSRNPINWYTHPAFTFGNDELSGIWVGKFETTGDINTPTILPYKRSLSDIKISVQFSTSRLFSRSENTYGVVGDSHMMKSSEWGVVVYLSQSIYGKYGNSNYIEENKVVYKNNSSGYYTGASSGFFGDTGGYNIYGTCKYDEDGTDREEGTGLCGPGASTTGNVYGVYDMTGGRYDSVMGNYNNTSGSSGFEDSWFTDEQNSKYFNNFTSTEIFTTRSTEILGHALYETKNWYSDYVSDFNPDTNSAVWIYRGGMYDTSKGIFGGSTYSGRAREFYALRIVLINPN